VLSAALLIAMAAAAPAGATPTLSYGCSPPAAPTSESCAQWHNEPVTIYWLWGPVGTTPSGGDCDSQTFTHDEAALAVSCKVTDSGDGTSTEQTVLLHIDQTPPTVTTFTPERPADFGGWWNHPLGFTFAGTDATSGIASCAPTVFGGPGTQVTGTCTDNAGNVGSGTFNIPYDSTPPSLAGTKASPGNGSATITWPASSGASRVEVERSPGPPGPVYEGSGDSFHDTSLANGKSYRYTVSAFDQANNEASLTVTARPQLWYGLSPARGAKMRRPPRLSWPAVKRASYYNVQLFAGKRKILTTWPARTQLKLRKSWTFQGRRIRLGPGSYRWYVWPGFGAKSAHRYGQVIGHSSFSVMR
jgi:hypothetical protein